MNTAQREQMAHVQPGQRREELQGCEARATPRPNWDRLGLGEVQGWAEVGTPDRAQSSLHSHPEDVPTEPGSGELEVCTHTCADAHTMYTHAHTCACTQVTWQGLTPSKRPGSTAPWRLIPSSRCEVQPSAAAPPPRNKGHPQKQTASGRVVSPQDPCPALSP